MGNVAEGSGDGGKGGGHMLRRGRGFGNSMILTSGGLIAKIKLFLLLRVQLPAIMLRVGGISFVFAIGATRRGARSARSGGRSSGDFFDLERFLPGPLVVRNITELCQEEDRIVHEGFVGENGIG
jgi:hypothetical protein